MAQSANWEWVPETTDSWGDTIPGYWYDSTNGQYSDDPETITTDPTPTPEDLSTSTPDPVKTPGLWSWLQSTTGMTTQQLLGLGAAGLAAVQASMQKSQDPSAQARSLYNVNHTLAHTPISIQRASGATESFDPYGSISVMPSNRSQVAYTGNPTGAGLNDINGNPTQSFNPDGPPLLTDAMTSAAYRAQNQTVDQGGLDGWRGKPLQDVQMALQNQPAAERAPLVNTSPMDMYDVRNSYIQHYGSPPDSQGIKGWVGKPMSELNAAWAGSGKADGGLMRFATGGSVDTTGVLPRREFAGGGNVSGYLPGSDTQLGAMDAPQIADAIKNEYAAAFGRPIDKAGLDYWVGQATSPNIIPGSATVNQLMQDILNGAQTQDLAAATDTSRPSILPTTSYGSLDPNLVNGMTSGWGGSNANEANSSIIWDAANNSWKLASTGTQINDPYVPPGTTTPTPVVSPPGGSSTVNPVPTVTPMTAQRSQVPFSGDWLHYGQGPEHLFYDTVNPLYNGPGSVWDPSATGANQAPTHSNENLSYIPPSNGPTQSTLGPTDAFTHAVQTGTTYAQPSSSITNGGQTTQPLARGGLAHFAGGGMPETRTGTSSDGSELTFTKDSTGNITVTSNTGSVNISPDMAQSMWSQLPASGNQSAGDYKSVDLARARGLASYGLGQASTLGYGINPNDWGNDEAAALIHEMETTGQNLTYPKPAAADPGDSLRFSQLSSNNSSTQPNQSPYGDLSSTQPYRGGWQGEGQITQPDQDPQSRWRIPPSNPTPIPMPLPYMTQDPHGDLSKAHEMETTDQNPLYSTDWYKALGYAGGGQAQGPLSQMTTPRMQGHVRGSAPGQQDNINAALSPGEYIMDADIVASLGDGNTDAGAKALDQMRQRIRAHKRAAPNTKIPPKAKQPLAYLKGGKI